MLKTPAALSLRLPTPNHSPPIISLLACLYGRLFIVNIAQLRDTIVTLLSASPDLIGEYILPDATEVPAVYVVGQQGVPAEWKAKGLEVTMRQFPDPRPGSPLGGTVKVNQLWEVILMQYTPASDTLALAMDRMVRRFPDATPRYFPGNDVAYERCRFVIPDLILRPLAS